MGFPQTKITKHKFRFLFWEKEIKEKSPQGWEDLGLLVTSNDVKKRLIADSFFHSGSRHIIYHHALACMGNIKRGKEKKELFLWCDVCLKKIK